MVIIGKVSLTGQFQHASRLGIAETRLKSHDAICRFTAFAILSAIKPVYTQVEVMSNSTARSFRFNLKRRVLG